VDDRLPQVLSSFVERPFPRSLPGVRKQYNSYCNLIAIVDNRAVHLPGEHPAAGGEDLRPRGDGVGDVAPFF
jgi:hypothetical protein